MSPVIVFRDNKPYLITALQWFNNHYKRLTRDFECIRFPNVFRKIFKKSRIHFQHLPDILFHEPLDDNLIEFLKKDKKLISRKLGLNAFYLVKKR